MEREFNYNAQIHDMESATYFANRSKPNGEKAHLAGSVYTPYDFAKFLTSWAIQKPEDGVLDVGIGEGVFVFAAYNRLRELGATVLEAQKQLFGAEIDEIAYDKFMDLCRINNLSFPNMYNRNFFEVDFPPVDAIVGNPPYIRRTYIEDVDVVRQHVVKKNVSVNTLNMTRMTDMYVYFLLQALPMLKQGGRLSVITSDPWLNMGYGTAFKEYLQRYFKIETLITLDRKIFQDAQVKPVLILATKKEQDANGHVHFVRVKNNVAIDSLHGSLHNSTIVDNNISLSKVKSSDLKTCEPWGIYFKSPEVYEELEAHRLMAHMANLAETRIGLQTLAKDFFVLTDKQARATQIESMFLEPLAQSIRYIDKPVINAEMKPIFHLFYCAKSKEELEGTYALQYILRGESTEVDVRGKNITQIGYHNKERIKRANRKVWYDLQSSLERRGRASILIPRLLYKTFRVVWNKAAFVPGELFIEFLPKENIDIEVYLAILTSSVSELMLRTHAQIYGGGACNIGPGQIKNVPMLNVALLSQQEKDALKQAYVSYTTNHIEGRKGIDSVLYRILDINVSKQKRLENALKDLLPFTTSSER